MSQNLKAYFTERILESISQLSSQNFPHVAKILLEHKYEIRLELRGQTVEGEPVGHILDGTTQNFKEVAEFGKGADYFKDKHYTKIIDDLKHCLNLAPSCERIFLMSSRECGPKRYTYLTRYANKVGRILKKTIEIYDGKSLSTYIVDEILENQDTVTLEKLQGFMPVFENIRNEYSYSNDLPKPPKQNLARIDAVHDVLQKISEKKFVQIHGISGMGKTYLAIQAATELKRIDPELMTLWISGTDIKRPDDLKSLKNERYSVPQNILGLMQRFECVVVIDSLESNVEEIIEIIKLNVKNVYNLIITSQSIAEIDSCYMIPPAEETLSKDILNLGLKIKCPENVYQQINNSIGGHPFLLNQINILIKQRAINWKDVEKHIEHLTASAFDNQAFYNRLFIHHLATAGYELKVLKWLNTKDIDQSMLLSMIGMTGIKKLEARNFFNIIKNGSYVLHDIVLISLKNSDLSFDPDAIESKFAESLKKSYKSFDPSYYRIIHAHKNLIEEILSRNKQHGIFCYSYLVSVSIDDYDERIVPEFEEIALTQAFKNYKDNDYYLIMSWMEYIEINYRRLKADGKYAETGPYLKGIIPLIEKLLQMPNRLKPAIVLDIKNHLGKFLRNADDTDGAIKVFNEILDVDPNFWAAKFHLSKIYRWDNKPLAQRYLSEIIDAYGTADNISSTIVLATFKEFRSHQDLDKLIPKFIDSFNKLLEETMISRFDLPYEVLGALSSRIQFQLPERMIELANDLPIPSENSIENKTLFDVGLIYNNTGKAHLFLGQEDKGIEYFRQSLAYFDKVKNPKAFELRQIAETYLLLNDDVNALVKLSMVPDKDRDLWWKFTHSKTLKMKQQYPEALSEITYVIENNKDKKHTSTFHRERGSIRYKLGDSMYSDDYQIALANCGDAKFKKIMEDELKSFNQL